MGRRQAGARGVTDEDGLPGELIVDRDERVVWGEGPRGTLAVHQELHQLPIHHMLLHSAGQQSARRPAGESRNSSSSRGGGLGGRTEVREEGAPGRGGVGKRTRPG